MQIVLCEDEKNFADTLKKEIQLFFEEKNMEVQLIWYGSGEELIKSIDENSLPDLLFMDIDLGTSDGVAVVKEIQKKHKRFPVIFLSAMEERVLDGFDVKAFYFLFKKDYQVRLFELLERYLKEYVYAGRITVKNKDTVSVLNMNEIYWVEAEERGTSIHTQSDKICSTDTIHSFVRQLDTEVFVEVYHCLYVNVDHISRVDVDSLLLDNEETVPVSRRKRKSVVSSVMKRLVAG